MSATRSTLLILCGLAAACNSPTETPDPGPFSVDLTSPWAGSAIKVTSPSFRGNDVTATLTLGTTTLLLVRHDDSTLSAVLPASAVGTFDLSVTVGGQVIALSPVTVHGFAEHAVLPEEKNTTFTVYHWPRNGDANVIGLRRDGALAMINLSNGALRTVPLGPRIGQLEGPGPTYQDGVWLLRHSDSALLQSWSLLGVPAKIADHPVPFATSSQHVARLGPDRWTVAFDSEVRHISTEGSGQFIWGPFHYGTYFSPRGDRAISTGRHSGIDGASVPIVAAQVRSVPGGLPAFEVGLEWVQAADFTPDGNKLIVTGRTTWGGKYYGDRLMSVDATSGAVRSDTTLSDQASQITADPFRPYVYVATGKEDQHPVLLVYDRSTMKLLARLETGQETSCYRCYPSTIAVDRNGVYVYGGTYYTGESAKIWRFTAPSVP